MYICHSYFSPFVLFHLHFYAHVHPQITSTLTRTHNQQVSRLYQYIIYIYTFSISVAHFIVARILFKYTFFFIVTVRLNIFNF